MFSLCSERCILAHRRVACIANGIDCKSAPVDVTDDMDEEREDLDELSETMDSGDETKDVETDEDGGPNDERRTGTGRRAWVRA